MSHLCIKTDTLRSAIQWNINILLTTHKMALILLTPFGACSDT
jgi:hypothetical protein